MRSLLSAAEDHSAFIALRVTAAVVGLVLTLATSKPLFADEGGNSLYLPGLFGSLAAVPGEPGWALALVYYSYGGHLNAGTIGNRRAAGCRLPRAHLHVREAGARRTIGTRRRYRSRQSLGSDRRRLRDSRWGFNDVVPSAVLRWNAGVHNYMVYAQTEITTGTYDPLRPANFGIGHGGIDAARAIHISIRRPATNSQRSPA